MKMRLSDKVKEGIRSLGLGLIDDSEQKDGGSFAPIRLPVR